MIKLIESMINLYTLFKYFNKGKYNIVLKSQSKKEQKVAFLVLALYFLFEDSLLSYLISKMAESSSFWSTYALKQLKLAV